MKKNLYFILLTILSFFCLTETVFAENTCHSAIGAIDIPVPEKGEIDCYYNLKHIESNPEENGNNLDPDRIILTFSGKTGSYLLKAVQTDDETSISLFKIFGDGKMDAVQEDQLFNKNMDVYFFDTWIPSNYKYIHSEEYYVCPNYFVIGVDNEAFSTTIGFMDEVSNEFEKESDSYFIYELENKGGSYSDGKYYYDAIIDYNDLPTSGPYKGIKEKIDKEYGKKEYEKMYFEYQKSLMQSQCGTENEPIEVDETKCGILPGQGNILVPTNASVSCPYNINKRISKIPSKSVDGSEKSYNFDTIDFRYYGSKKKIILYGGFTGEENLEDLISFYATNDIKIDSNDIESIHYQNGPIYMHNIYFNYRLAFNSSYDYYGCPKYIIISTDSSKSTTTYIFESTINSKQLGSLYIVYQLDESSIGGNMSYGGNNYHMLDYEKLSNYSSMQDVRKYIDDEFGKDNYFLEYSKYKKVIDDECSGAANPENPSGTDEECYTILSPGTIKLLKTIFTWVQIVAPILVIVLTAADFASAMLKDDADALKKATGNLTKRLIIVVALFFVPLIVKILLDNINSLVDYDVSTCGLGK